MVVATLIEVSFPVFSLLFLQCDALLFLDSLGDAIFLISLALTDGLGSFIVLHLIQFVPEPLLGLLNLGTHAHTCGLFLRDELALVTDFLRSILVAKCHVTSLVDYSLSCVLLLFS